jgi:hypothetical protein
MKLWLIALILTFALVNTQASNRLEKVTKNPDKLEGANLIGSIIGGALFLIFILYTFGRIVVEEKLRHRIYGSNLKNA